MNGKGQTIAELQQLVDTLAKRVAELKLQLARSVAPGPRQTVIRRVQISPGTSIVT